MFTIYISRKSRDKREVIVKIFIFLFAHLNILLPFPLREKTQHMFPDKNHFEIATLRQDAQELERTYCRFASRFSL